MGLGNKYVRLNVGGSLFYTTLQVLTRENSLLKAMFSGKKEVFTDKEGMLSVQWADSICEVVIVGWKAVWNDICHSVFAWNFQSKTPELKLVTETTLL